MGINYIKGIDSSWINSSFKLQKGLQFTIPIFEESTQPYPGTETQIKAASTRILTSMGQSLWDDIKIPGPEWDT